MMKILERVVFNDPWPEGWSMTTLFNSPVKIIMAGICFVVMWRSFIVLRDQGKWKYIYLCVFVMCMGNIIFNIQIGQPDATTGAESLQSKIMAISVRNDFIVLIVMMLGFTLKRQFDQYQRRIEELEKKLAERDKP